MSGDIAPAIEKLLKAYENGIKLAKRVSRRSTFASAAKVLEIQDSAQGLQAALEKCVAAIVTEYTFSLEQGGHLLVQMLADHVPTANRLKELRADLLDQINECPDFDEDPNQFSSSGFAALAQGARQCCTDCIIVVETSRRHLLHDRELKRHQLEMPQHPPEGATRIAYELPTPPPDAKRRPSQHISHLLIETQLDPSPSSPPPTRLQIPWAIASPMQAELSAVSPAQTYSATTSRGVVSPLGTYDQQMHTLRNMSSTASLQASLQNSSAAPSLRSKTSAITLQDPPSQILPPPMMIDPASESHYPRFIPSELIVSRISANDDFLERRRRSRTMFQQEAAGLIAAIEEEEQMEGTMETQTIQGTMGGTIKTMNSPTLGYARPAQQERLEKRSPPTSNSDYDSLVTRERSIGQTSQDTMSSRGSSVHAAHKPRFDIDDPYAHHNINRPASPPLSHRTSSSTEHRGHLPIQMPIFDQEYDSGLEVVPDGGFPTADTENLPMLASEIEDEAAEKPTPASSVQSMESPMRFDGSFYKFGGFCEGAKAIARGEAGFKVVRKTAHGVSTLSAKCIKCSYEVDWDEVEKDRMLDRSGIYTNSGIKWRQKFISKCHVRTTTMDEPQYACPFCVEEGTTVEEHDATVFFTINQLFRHLAKHDTPVCDVAGITTIYGAPGPTIVDFDLNFTTNEPRPAHYSIAALGSKVASRAAARAITTHRPKPLSKSARDPEGNPTLHYAEGARIVGISFPDRFYGQYCIAYHDNSRGSLPVSTLLLDMPGAESVKINPDSALSAVVKWDYKPKSGSKGGISWLRLTKGDRITCIAYTFLEHWCWSGCNARGKFGLFPAAFVEGLADASGAHRGGSDGGAPVSPVSPIAPVSGLLRHSTTSRLGALGALGSRMATLGRKRSLRVDSSREKDKERERERAATVSSIGSGPTSASITYGLGGSPLRAATTPSAALPTTGRLLDIITSKPSMGSLLSAGGTSDGGGAMYTNTVPSPTTMQGSGESVGKTSSERELGTVFETAGPGLERYA